MRITTCAVTDVGRRRQSNEDHFLVNDELDLYVVCDGMGGYEGGEIASQIAVDTIEDVVARVEPGAGGGQSEGEGEQAPVLAGEALRYAVRLAGQRIWERGRREETLAQMGTTAVAMRFLANHVVLAHVGDSRAYLVRRGTIRQLTEDHSVVAEFVRLGVVAPENARTHPLKNQISRAVGHREDVEVDVLVHRVERGDRVLLCSDGLSNLVLDVELAAILAADGPLDAAAAALVALANERGGDDNITLVLAQVDALDSPRGASGTVPLDPPREESTPTGEF